MVTRAKTSTQPTSRVLLVDDHRAGMMARRSVLEELGYKTDGTTDPRKALEMFRKEHYDLVVTDYKMPELDGVELISKLRAEKPGIPVILISGFVDVLGLNEKNTGASSVIMKSANEVQHLVRSAVRLLKTPRKPVRSERGAMTARKKAAN
jgi:CheY-like chemotaxis protein